MANEIPMTTREAIKALQMRGYSKRKIARELGIHRNTVAHYLGEAPNGSEPAKDKQSDSKCTIPTPGSSPGPEPDPGPELESLPSSAQNKVTKGDEGNEQQSGPGSDGGRQSHCEGYREIIEAKLEAQLHAKRIWQDLVDDHQFKHSYQSVKRFVAKLKQIDPQRVWRMECEPGEEAQVDYGTLWIELAGKRKKVHVLRVTLSHSRKGYTEVMLRQDTESFIRGIENAFRHWGGVPRLLVLDNLKAGVLKPCHYDPELNPKFADFCEHYGVVALPTLPRTPEHKGKVESGVGYVKESALKGKAFDSLFAVNTHLRHWEKTRADKRIHGTTRKQVGVHFEQSEAPALQPLPVDLFPSFVEARRKVHRDSYVEFERAYYEVPPEYINRELWVRSDGRMVHLFNQRMEQVAVHVELAPGQFTKVLGCGGTPRSVQESLQHWEQRVAKLGPDAALWARGLVLKRKEAGLRVLMGVIHQLLPRHDSATLNQACGQARHHGQYRLRELKNWVEAPAQQEAFSFLENHELIRDMDTYGQIVGFEQNN